MSRRFLSLLPAAIALALTSSTASAQITHLECFMDGAGEVPPVATTMTGRADYVLNTANNTLKYNVSFTAPGTAQTGAHIHVTATTNILFGLPLGSPITGSIATSAGSNATILTPNGTYTNIHTMAHPGGEIRGTNVVAPSVGTKMCFGDGTGGACPCGNVGAPGRGCENSVATGGALLEASGHVSPDNVVLISTGERATAISIFMQGNVMIAPVTFGDGLRCLNGIKRLATKTAVGGAVAFPEGAEPSVTTRAAALGQPNPPGSTRWYQTYYRDGAAAFCAPPVGDSFNSTNMVQITW